MFDRHSSMLVSCLIACSANARDERDSTDASTHDTDHGAGTSEGTADASSSSTTGASTSTDESTSSDTDAAPSTAPALFFTDLTSGPNTGGVEDNGVFITLYGERFGATRGDSRVTLDGVEVAAYTSWGEDNADARGLDMIVVQPGPDTSTGDLVVTVDGRASNPLPFTVRDGNILFVRPDAPNADDANAGTHAEPFATIFRQNGQVHAGDVVYVDGGTWNAADPRYPGWDCALCFFPDNDPSGTADAPVAWVGYPGNPPILGGPAPLRRGVFVDATMESYVIAKMHFTGYGGPVELWGNDRRVVGNLCDDGIYSNGGAIGVGGDSEHYRIYGNRLTENGEPGDKLNGTAIYIQGFGTNRDIDVGWNHVDNQRGARSIQVYGHVDDDWIDDLHIHDNLLEGAELNNIVLGGSDGVTDVLGTVYVENNVIIGAGDPGLRINDPAGVIVVANNLLFDNADPGYAGSQAQLYIERAGEGLVTFRDNLVVARGVETYALIDAPAGDAAIVADHNLYFGAGGCPSFEPDCIAGDPMFVDIGGRDFALLPGSAARDAGSDAGVARDHAGVARPQGAGFDIGPLEALEE